MIDYTKIGESGKSLHPTRKAILEYIDRFQKGSPNEIHEATGIELSNVSYHVKVMREYKKPWLISAGTAQRRGALEHYYRAGPAAPLSEAAAA